MSAPLRSASRMASFGHALLGIARLLQTQANARIHLMASTGVVGLGLWLPLTRTDWALLVFAMGGVWVAEALNTALETVVDLVSPEWHALARDAKDIAAGAVLLATLVAVAVGLLVLVPALVTRLA